MSLGHLTSLVQKNFPSTVPAEWQRGATGAGGICAGEYRFSQGEGSDSSFLAAP